MTARAGRFGPGRPRGEPDLLAHGAAAASPDLAVRLRAHALSATVAVVPASLAVLIAVDHGGEVVEGIALQCADVDFSIAEAWRRSVRRTAADPFGPAAAPPVAVTLLADLPEALARACRAHLAGLGLVDRACVSVRVEGRLVATVTLLRGAGAAPFTARDATALERLQPVLELAHACAPAPRAHAGRRS